MTRAVLLLFAIFVFSCDHDDEINDCGVSDPLELAWFRDKTELINNSQDSEYQYFSQGNYQGNRVYFNGSCCLFCNTLSVVYDCEGNPIGYLGTEVLLGPNLKGIDPDGVSHKEIIWKSDNNTCVFD